jgi:glycosyltransferase involved in cell wall biosynthesis
MISLHLTGGDNFGWALDEDLRTFAEALPAGVAPVSLEDSNAVYSPWWRGLEELGAQALEGKVVLCGLDNPLSHWVKQPRFHRVLDVVSLWVAHSDEALMQARALGLPARYVPYMLRTDVFRPLADVRDKRSEFRAKWNISESSYLIGNFQRDTEGSNLAEPKLQKGPDLFAEVMRELVARGFPVHVLLAGPRRHWLSSKLAAYGVPFTFVGKATAGDDIATNLLSREQLNELYQMLDLYVLTSRWEGGPYALLEAAGTRCKVVSTPVGIARDILEPASLAADAASLVERISADINGKILDSTIGPQYERVQRNHTPLAARKHVGELLAEIPRVQPFAIVPQERRGTIPWESGRSLKKRVQRVMRRLPRWRRPLRGRTVTFFREFVKPPYGGGNQFMLALRNEFSRRGINVLVNEVNESVEGYFFDSVWFDEGLLNDLAKLNRPKVVHRIDGPIHLYRGKDKEIDDRIFEINRAFATSTVLQSVFTMRKVYEVGYRPVNPLVVWNGANPEIFNLTGRQPFSGNRKTRIISTSWSNNPLKGGDVYKWLDENLDFDRVEYLFVGRASANFRNIRMIEPVGSEKLAEYLRSSDIYITASQNDPCSNALIEAMSCGLPAVYLNSGGHPELVGYGGLPFEEASEVPDCLDRISAHYNLFQNCLRPPTIAQAADAYLACLDD